MAKPKRKKTTKARRKRRARRNPSRLRIRGRRRLRRNEAAAAMPKARKRSKSSSESPYLGALAEIEAQEASRSPGVWTDIGKYGPRVPRGLRKKQKAADTKRRQKVVTALRKRAAKLRSGAKGKSVTAITRRAQAARITAIAAVLSKRGKGVQRSPLVKAMSIKTNPGLAGLKTAAMVLVPQAGVGAVGMVGLAMAGKKVAGMVADKLPVSVQPYAPALATAGLSVVAYVVADKVAPKYKGAIAIGGMLAAVIQAIAATPAADKAREALLGEYTTVGGGIFRGVGEYTTVGNAHPFRPRNYGDDQMDWAADSLSGLGTGADNATEFAPGEGGILSGGIFR